MPEQNTIDVRLGDVVTVNYKVINQAARAITAQASYNVAPPQVGGYFNKINCFCFTEQTLKAGETREMAVVFYVDPKIAEDRDMNDAQYHHVVLYLLPDARSGQARRRGGGQEFE